MSIVSSGRFASHSKRLLKRLIHTAQLHDKRAIPADRGREFFSQQGEDMILDCLFQNRPAGFYVDVGAHHPWRFSNTYFFYLRGWRGINIDAMPGGMEPFQRERPRDINLECAIGESRRTLIYHMFDEPAVNSFSTELSRCRDELGNFKIIRQFPMETRTLAEVLDASLPSGQGIDFLNVDVEGLDLEVLRSNDWGKYRPTLVLSEDMTAFSLEAACGDSISRFMKSHGYVSCAKAVHTVVYVDETQLSFGPDHGVILGHRNG